MVSKNKVEKNRLDNKLTEYDRLHQNFRKSGNPVTALSDFRCSAHPDIIYRNAARLVSSPFYKPHSLRSPFPKVLSEMPKAGFPFLTDFARALSWVAGSLEAYSDKIRYFLEEKPNFEAAILHSDLESAQAIINRIENEVGISLWTIENRINILSQADGQGAVSRYLRKIQYENSPHALSYFVSWLSYRSGATVDHSSIKNLIASQMVNDSGVYTLLRGYLGIYSDIDVTKAGDMLYWIDSFPVIDRYNLLLLTLQMLVCSPSLDTTIAEFTASRLKALNELLPDPQLRRLYFVVSESEKQMSGGEVARLVELQHKGNHAQVVNSVIVETRPSLEAMILGIRSSIAGSVKLPKADSESRSLFAQICEDLVKVFTFSEEGIEAKLRLQKINLIHSNTSWASALTRALARQTNNEDFFAPTTTQSVASLRIIEDEPSVSLLLPRGTRSYINAFPRENFPISVGAVAGILFLDEVLVPETAAQLSRCGNHADAIAMLSDASYASHSNLLQGEAQLLVVHAYLAGGNVASAVDLAARQFVSSRYYGTVLPIERLVNALLEHHDLPMTQSPTRGRLSVAIVYDIFSRYISSDYEAHRADAFKDVLKKNKLRHASELIRYADRFDTEQLIYFLRFICVPDVLDQSLALDSTRAVEDERVAILIGLSDLTADNGRSTPAAIKEELREIRTKQVVRDTSARLDQSKIYVNVDGIKRALDISMRESWNRYKFILSSTEDQALQSLERLVRSSLGDGTAVVVSLNTPTAERRTLFNKMLVDLRDQFTTNKEYGLNSNLSTNIRHGYVLRELRGALVGRELIRNKNDERGSYHENTFWLDRIAEDETEARESLSALLADFSQRIDDCIDRVNRQLLRIRSEQNPEGLFDYTLHEFMAQKLENNWSALETHEEFMDAAISTFWDFTHRNLSIVRGQLQADVLSQFLAIIADLENALRSQGLDEFVPGLITALTMVKPDVRAAFERVANWFTLSNNNDHQDFEIELALQAGLKTISTYYKNVNIQPTVNIACSQMLKGWSLPFFARLFFQILDNAGQHGAADRDELSLDISIKYEKSLLHLRVENDLAPGYDLKKLEQRVNVINSEYGQERAMDLLGEEGGSGYPKIWKLLRTDLKQDHDLVASVVGDRFRIDIVTTMNGIIL